MPVPRYPIFQLLAEDHGIGIDIDNNIDDTVVGKLLYFVAC